MILVLHMPFQHAAKEATDVGLDEVGNVIVGERMRSAHQGEQQIDL